MKRCRRLFRELSDRLHLGHFKDLETQSHREARGLTRSRRRRDDYPLLISEIRRLNQPLPCIIEHIQAESAEMKKTKAWVENQLR